MVYTEEQELLLSLPTFVLAIFSLIGSSYVSLSAYCLRRYKRRKAPFIITQCVFWMSLCDIMINIWILLVWAPPVFSYLDFWTDLECKIIASFGQFFLVASVCWYSVIIWCIWKLVTSTITYSNGTYNIVSNSHQYSQDHKYSSNDFSPSLTPLTTAKNLRDWKQSFISTKHVSLSKKLNRITKFGGIFTVLFASIMTGIPWIGNAYGYVLNVDTTKTNEFECWINNSYYQLTLYGPIVFYMIFAIILLSISIHRAINVNSKIKSNANFTKSKKTTLIKRLTLFTLIFLFTWTVPLTVRLWPYITNQDYAPFILVVLHHAFIGFIGLGNSIVWITSGSFQGFTKSIKYNRMKGNPSHASSPADLSKQAPMRISQFLSFGNKDDTKSIFSNKNNKNKNRSNNNTFDGTQSFSNITQTTQSHTQSIRLLSDGGINPNSRNLGIPYKYSRSHNNINPTLNSDYNKYSTATYSLGKKPKPGSRKNSYKGAYSGGIGGQGGGFGNRSSGIRSAAVARKKSNPNQNNKTSYIPRSIEMTESSTRHNTNQFSIYDSGVIKSFDKGYRPPTISQDDNNNNNNISGDNNNQIDRNNRNIQYHNRYSGVGDDIFDEDEDEDDVLDDDLESVSISMPESDLESHLTDMSGLIP